MIISTLFLISWTIFLGMNWGIIRFFDTITVFVSSGVMAIVGLSRLKNNQPFKLTKTVQNVVLTVLLVTTFLIFVPVVFLVLGH